MYLLVCLRRHKHKQMKRLIGDSYPHFQTFTTGVLRNAQQGDILLFVQMSFSSTPIRMVERKVKVEMNISINHDSAGYRAWYVLGTDALRQQDYVRVVMQTRKTNPDNYYRLEINNCIDDVVVVFNDKDVCKPMLSCEERNVYKQAGRLYFVVLSDKNTATNMLDFFMAARSKHETSWLYLRSEIMSRVTTGVEGQPYDMVVRHQRHPIDFSQDTLQSAKMHRLPPESFEGTKTILFCAKPAEDSRSPEKVFCGQLSVVDVTNEAYRKYNLVCEEYRYQFVCYKHARSHIYKVMNPRPLHDGKIVSHLYEYFSAFCVEGNRANYYELHDVEIVPCDLSQEFESCTRQFNDTSQLLWSKTNTSCAELVEAKNNFGEVNAALGAALNSYLQALSGDVTFVQGLESFHEHSKQLTT